MSSVVRTRELAVALGVLLMAAQGCKKSEPEPQQSTEPAENADVKPATAEAKEPEPKPLEQAPTAPKTQVTDGIPTEEDYEEEAAEVVTAENLEAQLDQLEAEIKAN